MNPEDLAIAQWQGWMRAARGNMVHGNLHRTLAALEGADFALLLQPDCDVTRACRAETSIVRGMCFVMSGDYSDKSVESFQSALKQIDISNSPRLNGQAYLGLAICYLYAHLLWGRGPLIHSAEHELQQALVIFKDKDIPGYLRAQSLMGQVKLLQGRDEEAMKHLAVAEEGFSAQPARTERDVTNLWLIAFYWQRRGTRREAFKARLRALNIAFEVYSRDRRGKIDALRTFFILGRIDAARWVDPHADLYY